MTQRILYKRWTDEEVAQIRKDKEVATIQDLMKLYSLTEGQVIHALYRYKPVAGTGKPVAAPKSEKAPPAFFSYEWWFGEEK